ncbi:MAG TPA: hypothetical protein VFP54_07185 [Acidimicrobiales bacterium]|nr:hypothetical protein [Acidimicrobiales bacterium]
MAVDRSDVDSDGIDEQVLAMRGQGRSFARIAAAVGLDKASQANVAFNRALRRQSPEEQEEIRSKENARLDRLAASVQSDEALSEADAERRLATVERLRARLMRD